MNPYPFSYLSVACSVRGVLAKYSWISVSLESPENGIDLSSWTSLASPGCQITGKHTLLVFGADDTHLDHAAVYLSSSPVPYFSPRLFMVCILVMAILCLVFEQAHLLKKKIWTSISEKNAVWIMHLQGYLCHCGSIWFVHFLLCHLFWCRLSKLIGSAGAAMSLWLSEGWGRKCAARTCQITTQMLWENLEFRFNLCLVL